MTIDLFLLQTMFVPLIADWSTFNSCAISVSVIDCANKVAIFFTSIFDFEFMRYQDCYMQYSFSESYVYAL